jgi:hypothetical protein
MPRRAPSMAHGGLLMGQNNFSISCKNKETQFLKKYFKLI